MRGGPLTSTVLRTQKNFLSASCGPIDVMATEEQEFDLSMPAVVDKYKSAGAVANGTAENRG